MRGLSANAALRVLRTAQRGIPARNGALSRLLPTRLFCANAPNAHDSKLVGTDATAEIATEVTVPPISAGEFGGASTTLEPIESVTNTDDAIPAVNGGELAAAVPTASAEENSSILPDEALVADVVGEDTAVASSTVAEASVDDEAGDLQTEGAGLTETNESVRRGSRIDLSQFETADELVARLEELVKTSTLNAMLLFRAVLEEKKSPLLTKESIHIMLPVMARNAWFQTVKDTLHVADENGIMLNTLLYNCALFAMTRTGDLKGMHETLERMKSSDSNSTRPNATSYNLLIAAHFYQGSIDEAFAVLQQMKTANIYPTIATYQTLVSGCLRRRDYRRAYQTLVAIEQQGMNVSAMTVAQVLYFAAHDDSYDQIMRLLSKLDNLMPLYSGDIDRISAKRSSYSQKIFRTSEHYRESERGAPRLEIATINAIMHSAFRGGRPDVAVRAWRVLTESYPDFQPTADHWYSMIGALAHAGNFAAAFDAVGHMREAGYTPRVQDLMNMLIRPLSADVDKVDEMYFHLVERLEGRDSVPETLSPETFEDGAIENPDAVVESEQVTQDFVAENETELHAAETTDSAELSDVTTEDTGVTTENSDVTTENSAELSEEADAGAAQVDNDADHVSLSKEIGIEDLDAELQMGTYTVPWADKRRAEVTITELNCVIRACALAGDLDRAFQTYDEACGRLGLTRNEDTLNALLEGCVQTRHVRGGVRIVEEARRDGTLMTLETLHLATRLYLRAGRGDDAFALLREASDEGIGITARTWQMLARHLARAGAFDDSAECVQLATKQGYRENAVRPRGDHVRRTYDERETHKRGGMEENIEFAEIMNTSPEDRLDGRE